MKNCTHDSGNILGDLLGYEIEQSDDVGSNGSKLDSIFTRIGNINKSKIEREAIEDIQDYTERTYEV